MIAAMADEARVLDVHHHVGNPFGPLGGALAGDSGSRIDDRELDKRLEIMERGGVAQAIARLQTILLSQPDLLPAEQLLESLATSMEEPGLATAFLRRRLRRGKKEAKLSTF